jgi:hypothetical protein
MAGWRVQLTGHEFDLRALERQLTAPELRVIQEHDEVRQDHSFYLLSSDFDAMNEAETVLNRAKEYVLYINGLGSILLDSFQPVKIGHILWINEDGSRKAFAFASANLTMRGDVLIAHATVTQPEGAAPPGPPPPSDVQFGVLLAPQDENVAKVLRLWKQNQDWSALYKVFEVIESDVGGAMWRQGWVSKGEVDRFTGTANSADAIGDAARHGHHKYKSPKKPMSLPDAQALIKHLVGRWLTSKRPPP